MNIPLDEVMYFDAVTHNPSTGAVSNADSPPTYEVYEEATDTAILTGQTMTQRSAITGNYRGAVTLSAGNGFELGKWYSIVAEATVNSVQGKAVARNFRIVAAENVAGKPVVDVDGLTAGAIADAVWEEAIGDHSGTGGSTAEKLSTSGGGGKLIG